jgi:hypothetical protein
MRCNAQGALASVLEYPFTVDPIANPLRIGMFRFVPGTPL